MLKKHFTRFLKQVEQKKQTVQEMIRARQMQEREQEKLRRQQEFDYKYDNVHREGLFHLYKKKAPQKRAIAQYLEMIEADYNENKVVVCGYTQTILKTVEAMMKAANLDIQIKRPVLASNKKKPVNKSPEKP